jgi:hypothetical protein
MEDKDLKKLFEGLKAADNEKISDFDTVINKKASKKYKKSKLLTLLKWSAAAAVFLIAGLLSYQQITNNITPSEVGKILTEEKNIMNWESETDQYLLTEYSQKSDAKTNKITIVDDRSIETQTEFDEIFEEELEYTNEDVMAYHVSISEWESTTDFLLYGE